MGILNNLFGVKPHVSKVSFPDVMPKLVSKLPGLGAAWAQRGARRRTAKRTVRTIRSAMRIQYGPNIVEARYFVEKRI